ncbi:MAG TPA: prohibitin family protein [Chthonomonadaceae bacterium]|nr:prohibitin family protein [Chthonomonadaceae bacterium]
MKIGNAHLFDGTPGEEKHKFVARWIKIALAFLALLLLLSQSFLIVQAGERALIYSSISGVQHYQLSEGLHFSFPLIWHPVKYDIKTRTYTMSGDRAESQNESDIANRIQVPDDSLTALTADGLPVTIDLSVRFHIDPDNVWRLHQEIGPDFIDKVVRPQSRSVARMTIAGFPVVDVYSGKRQSIVEQIQSTLRPKFQQNYLILDEVLLRDIRFSNEFQAAIEQKQVAQQASEQMVYELQRAESEKQQKILQAQGEAESIRKVADALSHNPGLIPYEYVRLLSPTAKIVMTDGKTIVSLGDLLGEHQEGGTR